MLPRAHAAKLTRAQAVIAIALGVTLGLYIIRLSNSDLPQAWLVLLVLVPILASLAIVLGNIERFLVAVIALDPPLGTGIHLFRFPNLENASVWGLDISLSLLSLILLYCMWAVRLIRGSGTFDPCTSISLPALFVIVTQVVSVQNAKVPVLSSFSLVESVEWFLTFLYLANYLRDRESVRFLLRVLLAGLLIGSLSVVATFLSGKSVAFMGFALEALDGGPGGFVRSGGLIGSPNTAAPYLVCLVLLAWAVILPGRNAGFERRLALLTLPLGLLALIVTFSRGGMLGFVVAGLLFILLCLHRKWLLWRHAILLIAVPCILVTLFQDQILYRFLADDSGSASSRIPLDIMASRMINAHPWIGVGIDNYMVVVKNYLTPDIGELGSVWLAPVHNQYLLVWSETGILGLLAFLIFYLSLGRLAWQCYRSEHLMTARLGAALLACLCGWAVHMMVDKFDDILLFQLLMLVVAMLFSLRRGRYLPTGEVW